jgi:hypothetical protein
VGHGGGIVAIDDGAPGVGVAIAFDHAEHGEAEGRGRGGHARMTGS